MVVKTRRALVDALQARLLELHPYDTPELLVLPVEHGAPGYLAWIAEVTAGD
jgi:periplasmic divalent cation tolerance protein